MLTKVVKYVSYVSLTALVISSVAGCTSSNKAADCRPKTVEGVVTEIDILTKQPSGGEVGRVIHIIGSEKRSKLIPFLYVGGPHLTSDEAISAIRGVVLGDAIRTQECTEGPFEGYAVASPVVISRSYTPPAPQ